MAEYLYAELKPVLPSEWGAQVDYLLENWSGWTPDKLVVHYGGNASFAGDAEKVEAKGYEFPSVALEMSVLRIYEQSHLSRGWRGLAYNYAIGQSGTLYICRAEQASGATSGDYEGDGIPENEEARAVLFLLGGAQEPTAAALATFDKLWALTPEDEQLVIGHRDVKGTTSCPGTFLLDYIHNEEYKGEDEMQYWLKLFALWSYEDLEAMRIAGYWKGVTAYYRLPDGTKGEAPDDAIVNLCIHIIANGNKDIPKNEGIQGPAGEQGLEGPAGPQGPEGDMGQVEIFYDGQKVAVA